MSASETAAVEGRSSSRSGAPCAGPMEARKDRRTVEERARDACSRASRVVVACPHTPLNTLRMWQTQFALRVYRYLG